MTDNHYFDGGIASTEDFETAIRQLLDAATTNGVDPRGSWVHRSNDTAQDFEAVIVELETNQ